ncbi:hypothetical protein ACLI1A_17100 [Flavobacterium sp. RHBU_3]|uniref:hypothetical protein n=1 Tax=Flavobacterium sp. RHBU_3 TaxID=3391184 RepID=UPI00398503B8
MRIVILSIVFLLISCRKEADGIHKLSADDFIFKSGKYSFYDKEGSKTIQVREFKDGSLTFSFYDANRNSLYDYGSVKTFSSYQKWGIFLDKKSNLWFYNSDLQEHLILIKDTTGYTAREFPVDTVLPVKFKEWLKE